MKLAIHDLDVTPYVENDGNGQSILHLSIGISIDEFSEESDLLTEEQKADLRELWFDEGIKRLYTKRDYGVEISIKP